MIQGAESSVDAEAAGRTEARGAGAGEAGVEVEVSGGEGRLLGPRPADGAVTKFTLSMTC